MDTTLNILQNKFNIIETTVINGIYNKFTIDKKDLKDCISFLKNAGEFEADILVSITAIDLIEKIELIYDIFSSKLNRHEFISIYTYSSNPVVDSVSPVFKSAEYDEREIFDLFGVDFDGNKHLKRLLMPTSTIGNPMLKNFCQSDERLAWNE